MRLIAPYASQPIPFTFTVKTDNAGTSNNDQFTLPLVSGGSYNMLVVVSDGTQKRITDFSDNTVTVGAGAGTYTVDVYGTLRGWKYNNGGDVLKILNISQWGIFNTGNQAFAFFGCLNLTVTATDPMNMTGLTSLFALFRDCTSLTTVPSVNIWKTSKITTFQTMFNGCINFNQFLSFDTSSATCFSFMLGQK